MLRFSTDLKLPNTLEKSPVVEQNDGRHKSSKEHKESGIKGTVKWERRTCNSRELVKFVFWDDSQYRKTSSIAASEKRAKSYLVLLTPSKQQNA